MDDGAATLAHACREAGIAPSLVGDAARPTTTKVRVVTDRNQQVARIDYEVDAEIADEVERRSLGEIDTHAPRATALVISDYLKGCITRTVVQAAVASVRPGVPVLVDPKIPHIDYYAGTTLVTPNHHEAEVASNMRIRSQEDARAAARQFRIRAQCGNVLITRGDQGMWLLSSDSEGHLPSAAREVADVTGAGDTVIATMAVMLAAGATMSEAARLSNEAAGISVARFGPATVTLRELLRVVEAGAST
jgi:D-beta-D-heptose 7-phosphate kinase/D-beta-D-heptose 1-phosphate adenosyltransferase